MGVTVDELLKVSFTSRNMDEKLKIILAGKPKPLLKISAVTINETDGAMLTKHFDPALYDQVEWLTGCDLRGSVFCWPCLLFKTADLWSTAGISDLILLEEGMPQHENSIKHIEAVSSLKSFIQHNMKVTAEKRLREDQQVNELVLRNREIIKLLTEAACGIVIRDIPTRLLRNTWCRLEMKDCVKTLQFLRQYNTPYVNHIDDAIALIKISPNLLDDVVDAIAEVLKLAIIKELQSSTYVSVILSEHSESGGSSQISTILRYVKDSKVCERFMGFANMGKRATPDAVYSHISKMMQLFGFSDRFLAVSVDGAVLKESNELVQLTEMLKTDYPHSFFVPCYFHGLHQVLRQSLSIYKECSQFFKTFNAMETFFKSDANRWRAFESFMFENIPALKNTTVLVESKFLKLVNTHKIYFERFFSSVEQNSKFWSINDVAKACGFKQFLKNFQTVFLLKVFTVLFEHTDTLETSLKSRTPENAFGTGIVTMVLGDLILERDEGFDALWNLMSTEIDDSEEPACKKLKVDETAEELTYKALFINIFHRSISEIQTRFHKLNILQFCRLLNGEAGSHFPIKSYRGASLYTDYLNRLMEAQGPFFDEEQIKSEIMVVRTHGSVFSEKSVYEILQLFREMNLESSFKNLQKLAELILTMPFRTPSLDETPNKIERILNFSYTPEKLVASGDISVLHLEKELLQFLKRDVFFYDEVIDKFIGINNTMELVQK